MGHRNKLAGASSAGAGPQRRETGIPGVSHDIAGRLAKLGITRTWDLALHPPLRYEDETRLIPIEAARIGQAVHVQGKIVDGEIQYRPRRQLVLRVEDTSGELNVRFLHFFPSQVKQLAPGRFLRLLGEIRPGYFGAEMVHPKYRMVESDAPLAQTFTPVYPTTAGVSQTLLRKLIDRALELCNLSDPLPDSIRMPLKLPEFASCLSLLHRPPADADRSALEARTHPAWRRIKFDELLAQQLSMRLCYRMRRRRGAPALPTGGKLTRALIERLPFRLTAAQSRAWSQVSRDLAEPHPMQRLLQGDVGSGKTIVAALAALQAVENGHQVAIMTPTEILAEQHFEKLTAYLASLDVSLAYLSASLKKREKDAVLESIAAGRVAIVIGTHALIQEQVEFAGLALAIIDEQHRFGVRQRLALRLKGAEPHQLMMSATPIPRTLAMSYYADLDVSVIDELPPGRTPVATKLVFETRRAQVIARVRQACLRGRQAYWVCPLIEEYDAGARSLGTCDRVGGEAARSGSRTSAARARGRAEALQLQTALETFETVKELFPELKVGLIHGRLRNAQKAAAMQAFVANEIQLLVATTVIEVGVDVPNASIMVIEHAERMGLAQLHQLRGRVGRGAEESACILLYATPLSALAAERLKIIFETRDGFEIARRDLKLRGPGEFLGARQSGLPLLRFADPEQDADLIEAARDCAERLLTEYPQAARQHLERWMGEKQKYLRV
jgi:ATP-dependent DNA helicase RecG